MGPTPLNPDLKAVETQIGVCRRCPRLVAWREEAAANPPRRFRGQKYWARPLSGFGDHQAEILIIGLAPAATGGNRTGRIFTGDRSGDWLFASLHRTGFANQAISTDLDDGLELTNAYVTAVVKCAPPDNRPTTTERDTCLPWMEMELALLERVKVFVALGAYAWDGAIRAVRTLGGEVPKPKAKFGHGAVTTLGDWTMIGCFHPSQRNTFTGRLTEPMTDEIFNRAAELARTEPDSPP